MSDHLHDCGPSGQLEASWHGLTGRRVLDPDGKTIGRVVDLVAVPGDDDALQVRALLVGRIGLLARIAQGRWFRGRAAPLRIPFRDVRLDPDAVHLLRRAAGRLPDDDEDEDEEGPG